MTRRRAFVAGLLLLGILVLAATIGPWLTRQDPLEIDAAATLAPPSWSHPLGTDGLGRDVAARIVHGARRSLLVGFLATIVAVVLGVGIGAASGVAGPSLDSLLSRFADTVYAFPVLIAAIAIMGLDRDTVAWLPPAARVGALAGLFVWPVLFRLVRADLRRRRGGDLAASARAAGATPLRVAFRHLLPQTAALLLAPASFLTAGAILLEAGLGLLGLGLPPPEPSWGNLLMDGRYHIETAWWLTAFPGLCVFLTVLACQLIGEGLADPD